MKRVFVGLGVLVIGLGVLLGIKLYKRAQAKDAPVGGTGIVEGVELDVVAKLAGRIERVLVDEGAKVTAGQPLVELDCADLRALRVETEARLFSTRAQAKAAQAAAEVASAAARVATAGSRASREAAKSAEMMARAAAAQAVAAREAASGAKAQTQAAQAAEVAAQQQAKAAEVERGVAHKARERVVRLAARDVASASDLDNAQGRAEALGHQALAAREGVSSAQARRAAASSSEKAVSAQAAAASAQAGGVKAQGAAARASARGAKAQAEGAAAQTQAALAQHEAAQKAVVAGEAALRRVDVQLAECTLRAPRAAVVQTRAFEPGEMAMPGARLLTLIDLSDARLVFYLPNADLAHATVGAEVLVLADAHPGRVFKGAILSVSSKAEFTPRNIQTREDRDRLVYAVKVAVPNPEQSLRAGMPVEVRLPRTRREPAPR